MLGKIIGGIIGTVVGGFVLLAAIGFFIESRNVCSNDAVRNIVDQQVDQKLSVLQAEANLGGAAVTGLLNWAFSANEKRPSLSLRYAIRSITTLSADLRQASCSAIVDISTTLDGRVTSSDTREIGYSMRKDDGGTWIVWVDTAGLDR